MPSAWQHQQAPAYTEHEAERKSIHPVTVAQLWQEHDSRRHSATRTRGRPKANYRPVSLQWWYISSLVVVLLGIAGGVVYAMVALRHTKSTGTVETRGLRHDEAWDLYRKGLERRQEDAQSNPPEAQPEAQPTDSTDDEPEKSPVAKDGNSLTTAVVEITTSFVSTGPPVTETFTTTTESVITSDVVTTITSSVPGFVTTIFPTAPEPTGTEEPPQPSGVESSVAGYDVVITQTFTGSQTIMVDVTVTTTKPGDRFVKLGTTRISSTFTVDRQGRKVEGAMTSVFTTAVGGTVITSVEQPQPTVLETIGPDGLLTRVTSTPAPITYISSVPPTKTVITATSAPTAPGDMIIVETTDYEITPGGYFIGKFLPPLLAVTLALAIRAVDLTAKLYQPFASLSHPLGAMGKDSLTLHFEGWKGFWRPFGMLAQGHPVPFLSTLAVWLSNALAPVATEAIIFDIQGHCKADSIMGCALTLGVSEKGSYALLALLGTIAVLLVLVMGAISARWKTGVFADPWCVAGAAALIRNPDIRALARLDHYSTVKAAVAEKRFCLGWFRRDDRAEQEEYGLVLCDEAGRSLRGSRREEANAAVVSETAASEHDGGVGGLYGQDVTPRARKPPATFVALMFWWRLVFMIYMVALMGFIIYYHLGIKVPQSLEDFFQREKFGARFISSALGMIVVLCWECIFDSVAILAPYRRMARRPQKASQSVLARRPTYAVTGIFTGIRERDLLLFSISTMAVLADFLPMLFANVPYDLSQAEVVHLVCARVAAGLLLLMVVVLFATMFARWPELPVDPRSVAGQMWYVAEARWAAERLDGIGLMSERERKDLFDSMGGKWYYSVTRADNGRMGVEMEDSYGLLEYDGLSGGPHRSKASRPVLY
ncbi:hypothetical protein NLU13_6464 [Sarocladium strictum]|uniref:Uncharacterized protein n=1 Tax=Sarocladium strictum TaxID=5046 RepID=A0AA39L7E9_SARSR|nr:hypothetical protein NLU13_6464 [Sarocladium strictum]